MPIARHGAIELAYETFGAAEGEPLLLISGTGVQMLMWPDAFVAALADRGFCVTRFDNRDAASRRTSPRPGTPAGSSRSSVMPPRPTGSRTWPTTPWRC